MNWVELTATIFGVICVVLTIKRNIWCWPTGLIQVILYIYIFNGAKLYSDMILHVIYVFLQIYGWYHWWHGGKDKTKLSITLLKKHSFIWVIIAVIGTVVWGFLMNRFSDASLPYPDAFTTVTSLVAQWLMARKKLESWYFWIAVDVVAIGVYWYKQLYLTTGLYAIFLVLATIGFFAWKKSYKEEQDTEGVKALA